MKNVYKPYIQIAGLSFKSVRSFCSALSLWFFIIFLMDYGLQTLFLNIHHVISLEFSFDTWRFSGIDEWESLFMHGFFSSFITGFLVLVISFFEKKKVFKTQMIKAFRQ